jgi:hypothetical protein
MVHVNIGTVHWVEALDVCNAVSWNVGRIDARQYAASVSQNDENGKEKFPSVVPMKHLTFRYGDLCTLSTLTLKQQTGLPDGLELKLLRNAIRKYYVQLYSQ